MALPIQFKKNGYNYVQIKRSENRAIYRQSHKDIDQVYFEVIKIRKSNKESERFGKIYPVGSESYPSSEHWGSLGWSYMNLTRALEVYETL